MKGEKSQSPILARLRAETRDEHDAIEAVLDVTSGDLTQQRYRSILEQFYGFYRPLEVAIESIGGWNELGIKLSERRKTPLLEADLKTLGVETPKNLANCQSVPRIETTATAFGALYVMEGATLGGQIISQHIQTTLGVTSEIGGQFFAGYGNRTGAMWQGFRAALLAFAAPQHEDEIVAASIETFRKLTNWFEEGKLK